MVDLRHGDSQALLRPRGLIGDHEALPLGTGVFLVLRAHVPSDTGPSLVGEGGGGAPLLRQAFPPGRDSAPFWLPDFIFSEDLFADFYAAWTSVASHLQGTTFGAVRPIVRRSRVCELAWSLRWPTAAVGVGGLAEQGSSERRASPSEPEGGAASVCPLSCGQGAPRCRLVAMFLDFCGLRPRRPGRAGSHLISKLSRVGPG